MVTRTITNSISFSFKTLDILNKVRGNITKSTAINAIFQNLSEEELKQLCQKPVEKLL